MCIKAILGATDVDSQEYFSRLAGTHEKLMTSYGTNRKALSPMDNGTSTNTQEMEKPLIKAQNFGMLDRIVLFTPFAMPYEKETTKEKRRKLAKLSSSSFKRNLTHGLYVPLKERDPIAYQWKMKAKALQEESTPEAKKDSKKSESFMDKHVFNIINEMTEDIYNCISPPNPVSHEKPVEFLAPFGYVEKLPHYAEKEKEINSKIRYTNGFAEYLTEKHIANVCRQMPKLFMNKRKRIENANMFEFLLKEDNPRCLQPNVFLRLITEINIIHDRYIKLYKKLYKVVFFSKICKKAIKEVLEEDFEGYFDTILEYLNYIKDEYFIDKSD